MNPDRNRRRLLAALAGMLVATPTLAGRRLLATPAQSAGPFYLVAPFNRVPVERRHLVQADFLAADMAGVELQAKFDLLLGGADGTPSG